MKKPEPYQPRRAMEPIWPWPWWSTRLPVLMVVLLLADIVIVMIKGQPFPAFLMTPLMIHVALSFWLPWQKRWAELNDRR